MAIQTNSLRNAEHDWYAIRSGVAANAPLNDHKLAYYASKSVGSGTGSRKPIYQLEREWLQKVGSSTSVNPYELWVAACQAQTVTVGRSVDECKYNFYTTIASGTNP